MTDKSWMLNPQAIRYAKVCIELVRKESDVKLKLSQPDFIQNLHQLVSESKLDKLHDGYSLLLSMAGPGTILSTLKSPNQESNTAQQQVNGEQFSDAELVNICGKLYPKWREGKKLIGLYHGQPSYQ